MGELNPQPHGGALAPAWAPGKSGNPAGRPPGRRIVAEAIQETLERRGGPKALAGALLDIALDPENKAAVAAIKEIHLRLEGPVKGDADGVSVSEARSMLAHAFEVIGQELDAPTAERVVRAILDRLAGMRTVEAEVVNSGAEGSP